MRRAGLTGVGKKGVWSAEECVQFLEECARHFGRFPSHKDLKEYRGIKGQGPDAQIYTRIWGSLTKARECVRNFHANKITWEQLIAGGTEGKSGRSSIPPRLRLMIFERDNLSDLR